ncbi:MAG: Grx4 family monothiol glutaredoxin [Myxococcota bacterium]
MAIEAEIRERIETFIGSHDVALFMKGSRQAPQCGFSATVVRILDSLVPDYATFDVLSDGHVREGIKEFSSWPTIPQLYVKGEFVGGCDIIQELYSSGELHASLGVEPVETVTPALEVTEAAAEALRRAVAQQGGGQGRELHLTVDARFQAQLHLSAAGPGEVKVDAGGLSFYFDPMSARRADGIRIDVVDTPQGQGFRIENPNAPQVRDMSPKDLEARLASGAALELLDVRTPEERATAHIEGSVLLTEPEANRLESLSRDTVLVFFSHRGERSRAAAQHFSALGFNEVYDLTGGIDAWSQSVDPSVPRY